MILSRHLFALLPDSNSYTQLIIAVNFDNEQKLAFSHKSNRQEITDNEQKIIKRDSSRIENNYIDINYNTIDSLRVGKNIPSTSLKLTWYQS